MTCYSERHERLGWTRVSVFYTIVCIAALVASGCALTTEHINLAYAPQPAATKVEGARDVNVRVEIRDLRPSSDVAYKINGYNMEMAPIIADNDIPGMVKDAIETELKNRGFAIGGGPVVVLAELSRFRNHFQIGFWSGTATADFAMTVTVAGADRKVIFNKLIVAQGVNPGIQLAGGNNAKIALEGALRDAMAKLFDDSAFLNSLMTAAKPSTKT